MNVFKPEIAELLALVEKKYTKSLRTTTDFDGLSFTLKYHYGETVSTSTLKRLWGYVNDSHQPRICTLDALSRYVGHVGYEEFCSWLKSSPVYNSSFFTAKQVMAKDLIPGSELEIGWSPNRYLRLNYLGDTRFKMVEARESKLCVGDCFEVTAFLLGQPLSLPYVLRDGQQTTPFIAGRNGGLTLVNCL